MPTTWGAKNDKAVSRPVRRTRCAVAVVPIEEPGAELVTWLFYREDDPSPAVLLVLEIAEEVAGEALSEPPELAA